MLVSHYAREVQPLQSFAAMNGVHYSIDHAGTIKLDTDTAEEFIRTYPVVRPEVRTALTIAAGMTLAGLATKWFLDAASRPRARRSRR